MSALISVQEYEGKAALLFKQAKEILTNPDSTPEDIAKVEQMVTDAKELKERAFKLEEIGKAAAEFEKRAENKSSTKPTQRRNRWYPQAKGSDFSGPGYWDEYMGAMFDAWASKGRLMDERLLPLKKAIEDPAEVKDEEAWQEKSYGDRKDLVESVGASGGFLVPSEFYAQLQSVEGEAGIVRPRATKIRMRRRSVGIPTLDQTTTTAGVPHWFGGMLFYWTEEATEKQETQPKFKKIYLTAYKLTGYSESSDELVDDSAISIGDFFNSSLGFAGGIAWMEDYAFLRGTGAGQPQGVVNAGATITVARQSVGTPVQYLDIVNMVEAFLPSARGMWAINQTVMSNLFQMTVGTMNVWQPSMQAGIPGNLFGMPITFTEKLPTVGNAGDVLLADWRYYLIGDRQATTVESTQFTDKWRYDLTSWRAVHRVDGQPWLSAPLTYQDGTVQVSPFVILGAKTT